MTPPKRATRHVVDRCPSCGVEHDLRASECEACDTPLRPWCRVHGRETGWLDGPACPRCIEETARPARPAPAPVLDSLAPAAVPAPAEAPPVEVAVDPPKPEGCVGMTIVMSTMLLITGVVGALGGAVLSLLFVLIQGGDIVDAARMFAVGGGVVGLLFGVFACVTFIVENEAKRRKS